MGLTAFFCLKALLALVLLVPQFVRYSFDIFLIGHTTYLIMTWLTNAALSFCQHFSNSIDTVAFPLFPPTKEAASYYSIGMKNLLS